MSDTIYFAWVDEGETYDSGVHSRKDENVFSFTFEHSEGDFASLSAVIKNPRIGLLNPGRKVWCILSYRHVDEDGNITNTPIFRGRLIGIPTNVFDTLVTLNFIARPADYSDQKVALADTLKVAPYWDPIFIAPSSWTDPDAVLEAYSALWHIDPVTLVLSLSDILVGEDGVDEIAEAEHFYDNMSVTLNQTPLRAIQVVATIPWTQSAIGNLDLTATIKGLFGGQLATSYTMEGLIDDWPKPGSRFGSGWEVVSGSMTDVTYTIPQIDIEDIFSWQGTVPQIPIGSVVFPLKVTGESHWGETAGFNFQFELVIAQLGYGVPELTVTYTAGRDFAEVVTFTMLTDQQSIVTLPGEDEAMVLTVNANKVSDPTEDASIPIVDVRRRGFVHTTRGLLAIEHLLLLARAHLIARSRAVEIAVQCDFRTALARLSLRKNLLVHDHRLPGGEAVGKTINVVLKVDGDSGEAGGVLTIASCVGKGGAYEADPGTPSYVDNTLDGVQEYSNQIKLATTADIAWTVPAPETFDDGIDFIRGLNAGNVIKLATLTNSAEEQEPAILDAGDGANTDQAKISTLLQEMPTQITVQLAPMEGGPFQREVVVSVSDLIVPMQINLEAPSNA